MDTINKCFEVILHGDKEQSRQAARRVRKLLYQSKGPDEFKVIKQQVKNAPENYTGIEEDWRQENFVMAISVIYFLHDREKQPDFLFPWLFELLRHERGNIRYAAVRMLRHELGPLTVFIRIPEEKNSRARFSKLTPEKADRILLNMFVSLQILSTGFHKPIYNRYKYIDSLPASPYKSVQLVLATIEEYCGKEYVDRMDQTIEAHQQEVTEKDGSRSNSDLQLDDLAKRLFR